MDTNISKKGVENVKKATIIVELVPEADVTPDEDIKKEIMAESKIPWSLKILEVKIEKPTSLKKW